MFGPLFHLPPGREWLVDLALDLRWTWTHEGDGFWRTVNPEVWEQTENPWLMLQSTPRADIERLSKDPEFVRELQRLVSARQQYLERSSWFNQSSQENALNTVAYFSMEFGLGEALPLYAGGLGVLAGDYLKTASDLNVPLVGVGLLYQEGYFRQILDGSGRQTEAYPYNDPSALPIRPVIDSSVGWLRIPLELPGRTILLRVWQAQVGRVLLYLLDSNDPLNSPADRGVTNKLYDDRPEIRLMQEMALGIGGWRLLKTLNIPVEICHLNEGHAAFAVIERARDVMQETKASFGEAMCAVRPGNVFTSHTPVAAGFDSFPREVIVPYFSAYLERANVPPEQFLALGNNGNDGNFYMAYLAMRGSISINGVSWLHGQVSRRIFQPMFPHWPEDEVPVTHVTNGVHVPSWDSALADEVWTDACGKERWLHGLEKVSEDIQKVTDEGLWAMRTSECQSLISYVRKKLAHQFRRQGANNQRIADAEHILDVNVMTIGFARRFTGYKRPNLLLTDPGRLIAILNNVKYPVQLIVAGKAHPDDEEGKSLVRQFVSFANLPAVRNRVVFLEDYDMGVAQQLVKGVDVWLNTPRRPWEACGTSGMKVLVNGGLNLSELDGWWAEAYTPAVGWALGDGKEHAGPEWDAIEADRLYELLEKEVVPEFYDRNAQGVPSRWVARMKASMTLLTPRFSSNRMLREYIEKIYMPATQRFRQRNVDNPSLASEIQHWKDLVDRYWVELHFGELRVELRDSSWHFSIAIYFGEFDPSHAKIELYAAPLDEQPAVIIPMTAGDKIPGAVNGYFYDGEAPSTRPSEHFTVRIIPWHPAVLVPLEDQHILWQH